MDHVDFPNSYFTFTVPDGSNTARIQLDGRAVVTDPAGKLGGAFFYFTPCKSEHMYTPSGRLWQDPNYDFQGIVGRDSYVIIRTFADHQPTRDMEWDAGPASPRFAEFKIDLRPLLGVRALRSGEEVLDATLANKPLYARTTVADAASGRSAAIDYRVTTMNVARPTTGFQVDTGPLLVPTWLRGAGAERGAAESWSGRSREPKVPADQFWLAFIVYQDFTGGEVVLRQPTPVAGGAALVHHHSRIVPIEAKHELFCVD